MGRVGKGAFGLPQPGGLHFLLHGVVQARDGEVDALTSLLEKERERKAGDLFVLKQKLQATELAHVQVSGSISNVAGLRWSKGKRAAAGC